MALNKKVLHVGGLADDIDVNLLKSTFSAFGDIVDVNLPLDYTTQKHKGFAFVEFQSPEDAADAIDNMDNGELLGRTIRVKIARPVKYNQNTSKPIWANDEYLRKVEGESADKDDT